MHESGSGRCGHGCWLGIGWGRLQLHRNFDTLFALLLPQLQDSPSIRRSMHFNCRARSPPRELQLFTHFKKSPVASSDPANPAIPS